MLCIREAVAKITNAGPDSQSAGKVIYTLSTSGGMSWARHRTRSKLLSVPRLMLTTK